MKCFSNLYTGCITTVCNIFIEWDGTTFYVPVLSKVGTSSIGTYPMVVWGYAVYKPIVCCVTQASYITLTENCTNFEIHKKITTFGVN